MKKHRINRILKGRCRECGTPCEDALCPEHQRINREQASARRRARGIPPRMACPCGIPGHYVCPTDGIPPELLAPDSTA